MAGQAAYTPQISSVAWTRTPAPSTIVNRPSWSIGCGGTTANTGGSSTRRRRCSIPTVLSRVYIGTRFDMTDFRHAEAGRNLANDRLRLAMESGKSVGWVSMCSFVEPRTPSTSPFVMKALASTSMSRVEACDSA
jgi:hypothetical protein